jgi:hypothetical protein
MNWQAIALGALGVFICGILGFAALLWGGQGDGYHASPRDAEETGGCLALAALITAGAIIIGLVIEAQ